MSTRLTQLQLRRSTAMLRLLLLTLLVFAAWMYHAFQGSSSLMGGPPIMLVRVSRMDFVLVLVLLLLNVAATHKVFRQFSRTWQSTRFSSGLLILSLLTLIIWICKLFLLQTVVDEGPDAVIQTGVGRGELLLAMALAASTLVGGFILLRRFRKAEPLVVISAYSKKVQCRGEWISIEQYLTQELGVAVSHGITPDEKDRALQEFAREQREEAEEKVRQQATS